MLPVIVTIVVEVKLRAFGITFGYWRDTRVLPLPWLHAKAKEPPRQVTLIDQRGVRVAAIFSTVATGEHA